MMQTAPCHHCTKRSPGCHAQCQDYAEFDRENKRRLAAKQKEFDAISDILQSPARIRQDRRRKKRQ